MKPSCDSTIGSTILLGKCLLYEYLLKDQDLEQGHFFNVFLHRGVLPLQSQFLQSVMSCAISRKGETIPVLGLDLIWGA
jgi:hypothetical protein